MNRKSAPIGQWQCRSHSLFEKLLTNKTFEFQFNTNIKEKLSVELFDNLDIEC